MTSLTNIAAEIAMRVGITQEQGRKAFSVIFEQIVADLVHGDGASRIHRFGTFSIKHREARERRNPQTGEKIQVAASTTARFQPAQALKDALNPKPPVRKVGGERNAPAVRRA